MPNTPRITAATAITAHSMILALSPVFGVAVVVSSAALLPEELEPLSEDPLLKEPLPEEPLLEEPLLELPLFVSEPLLVFPPLVDSVIGRTIVAVSIVGRVVSVVAGVISVITGIVAVVRSCCHCVGEGKRVLVSCCLTSMVNSLPSAKGDAAVFGYHLC